MDSLDSLNSLDSLDIWGILDSLDILDICIVWISLLGEKAILSEEVLKSIKAHDRGFFDISTIDTMQLSSDIRHWK